MSLSDLSLQGGGLFEQRIGLVLRVVNPNRRELAIDGMSFELELNGKKFARGVSDRSLSIPGLGEAPVDVSAVTSLAMCCVNSARSASAAASTIACTERC